MPSEKKFFKYRKRDKRKLKWLKNKYKRDIDVDGVKNFIWQIEDNSKAVKRKIESDEKSSVSSKKRKYCSDIDLFESSVVCIPKKISNDFLNEDICKSEKTFSSSKCSEASDCTSPSEITEVNEDNLRESSLIEDVAMTEFVTKLNDSACDLSTSQTLSSESTCYSNEEKENFVFDKVNEDITYNNIHSLPVRLENIEKNTYEVDVDNKIESNDFVCNATNNSCDNNFMNSVNIVNNQTNENCSQFNEYSVSNIKSDMLDKSISTCNHEISSEQNNKQNNSWIYNDKSEINNLSGTLELAVNMKDTEKCEESLFNLKCQDGALLLRESSEVLDCNRSVSRIESNITGCTENSNEENPCIKKLPASDLFSSTSYLSVKKHSSEDVIDKKNEREQNSDFHENLYPSMYDKTEDENENLQVTCNDRKSENLSVLPVRPNSIEKDNHLAADSIIEIQNHKSFIEETSDFFDNSVNNVDDVHSISTSHDLNISLSATVDDNQHSNISADHSTDETFDKKGSKPRSPRTRNELNKTCNANLAGGNRKKLLSKIRNLSRNSKKPIVLNNLEAGNLQFREKLNGVSDTPVNKTVNNPNTLVESVPIIEPPKKQRIAHTPKTINFNVNSESNNQIAQAMKRAKSLSKDQIEDNNDKVSIIMNEIDKTFKVMAKVPCTSSALSALPCDPISISSIQDNASEYNSRCLNPTNNGDNVKNCNDKLVKALTPSAVLSEIHQESPEITSIRENQCFDRIFSCQDNLSNNERKKVCRLKKVCS
ncbi:PREDICTED: uncharacterized protein PFB0145c-like [Ceratosolen solmsi marchali]|uniref:Uncharacterized protein PFB0145c-like n=1 Tax=Ceratosolen solmsi marchali TaxID=326594 RepID=A0AAJ6YMN1_9HYME|nr:PREDICTED: uncharacterized protein PFB0145c-like [Ceratosolen solmsi marchali]